MAKSSQPFRIIELITLLVIAGLIVAITLPRCTNDPASTQNQSAPASVSATP